MRLLFPNYCLYHFLDGITLQNLSKLRQWTIVRIHKYLSGLEPVKQVMGRYHNERFEIRTTD